MPITFRQVSAAGPPVRADRLGVDSPSSLALS
jgi:hypothetical protein